MNNKKPAPGITRPEAIYELYSAWVAFHEPLCQTPEAFAESQARLWKCLKKLTVTAGEFTKAVNGVGSVGTEVLP